MVVMKLEKILLVTRHSFSELEECFVKTPTNSHFLIKP